MFWSSFFWSGLLVKALSVLYARNKNAVIPNGAGGLFFSSIAPVMEPPA
jgi:hypothetical protein